MIEPVYSDRWIDDHVSSVFRTCRKHTPSEDSAWDAFQETFMAYSRRKDSLNLESDPGPWLRETARRCSLAVCRRERRHLSADASDFDGVSSEQNDDPSDAAFLREAASVLREEFNVLSKEEQQLLHLIYVDGMTHRDAAIKLNMAPGSIHAKAQQARDRLRRRMKRRGIALSLLLLLFLLQGNAEAAWTPTLLPSKPVLPRRLKWQTAALAGLMLIATALYGQLYWNGILADGLGLSADAARHSCESSCAVIEDDSVAASGTEDLEAAQL